MTLTAADIQACRDQCYDYLQSVSELDWTSAIPDIDMDVAGVVAHMAGGNFWYAIDLAARGQPMPNVTPEVSADADAATLLASLVSLTDLLAAVVQFAPADARGFHPFGRADPDGFAAMSCDEMIVHTHDISRGLGVDFAPPLDLVEKVLARLFPWITGPEDPWTLLQFANGRIQLPGRTQPEKWRWHCAPLSEWDGNPPDPTIDPFIDTA